MLQVAGFRDAYKTIMPNRKGAFQIVAGWWRHQQRRPAVTSAFPTRRQVFTAHMKPDNATIGMHPMAMTLLSFYLDNSL